jgi:hypothetical protein
VNITDGLPLQKDPHPGFLFRWQLNLVRTLYVHAHSRVAVPEGAHAKGQEDDEGQDKEGADQWVKLYLPE